MTRAAAHLPRVIILWGGSGVGSGGPRAFRAPAVSDGVVLGAGSRRSETTGDGSTADGARPAPGCSTGAASGPASPPPTGWRCGPRRPPVDRAPSRGHPTCRSGPGSRPTSTASMNVLSDPLSNPHRRPSPRQGSGAGLVVAAGLCAHASWPTPRSRGSGRAAQTCPARSILGLGVLGAVALLEALPGGVGPLPGVQRGTVQAPDSRWAATGS